jgi:hypothetical protein
VPSRRAKKSAAKFVKAKGLGSPKRSATAKPSEVAHKPLGASREEIAKKAAKAGPVEVAETTAKVRPAEAPKKLAEAKAVEAASRVGEATRAEVAKKQASSISVAQQLQGALVAVANREGFELGQSALAMADLALALVHYKEEGVEMFPEVLVASSIEHIARALQVQDKLRLGTATNASEAVLRLLKHAAPLCRDGWLAYAQIEPGIEYGVVRCSSSPLALPLHESITGCSAPAILFYQAVSRSVRVVGARGSEVDININIGRTAAADDPVAALAAETVAGLPDGERAVAAMCMNKILTRALRAGHGALVAVLPGLDPLLPSDLFSTDNLVALPAECCMDFGAAIHSCIDRITLDEAYGLDGAASLLTGMMMSDGVTVFSSHGRVLAYRAFLSPRAAVATGGARRRAFMTLADLVGTTLSAAFMRSQDGHMEIKRGSR